MQGFKSLIVLSILFGIIASEAASLNGTECPQDVPSHIIILLPYPGNCTLYIECSNGVPVVLPCPEGLHWNSNRNRCDYPENAKCENKTIQLNDNNKNWNDCADVPENIDVLLPNPSDCGTYIQCVHQKPLVRPCPSGLHWSTTLNRCEWPEIANCKVNICDGAPENQDVLLPNPDDCGSYIQCVHQKPFVRPCPTGLHWSVYVNRCEWPNIAQCDNTSTTTDPSNIWPSCDPTSENDYFPNPENCNSFLKCVEQRLIVGYCPVGLHWNIDSRQCDWPHIANCNINVNP